MNTMPTAVPPQNSTEMVSFVTSSNSLAGSKRRNDQMDMSNEDEVNTSSSSSSARAPPQARTPINDLSEMFKLHSLDTPIDSNSVLRSHLQEAEKQYKNLLATHSQATRAVFKLQPIVDANKSVRSLISSTALSLPTTESMKLFQDKWARIMHDAQVEGTKVLYNARVTLAQEATDKVNNFLKTASVQARLYLEETNFIPPEKHAQVILEFEALLSPLLASIRQNFLETQAKKDRATARTAAAKAKAKDEVVSDPTGSIKQMIHNQINIQLKKHPFLSPSQRPGKQGKQGKQLKKQLKKQQSTSNKKGTRRNQAPKQPQKAKSTKTKKKKPTQQTSQRKTKNSKQRQKR